MKNFKLTLTVLGLALILCACGRTPAQPVRAVLIAAGGSHTCVLSPAGGVRCWGSNEKGQLGDGTLTASPAAVDAHIPATDLVAVAAGSEHTCALGADGRVWCWGANAWGQLGNGSQTDSPVASQVKGLDADIVALAAGARHTCALSARGRVSCWGANDFGQLGNKTKKDSLLPVAVSGLESGMAGLSAGDGHTCALTTAGGVKCWGANDFGQLGNKTKKASLAPVDVSGLETGTVAIAAGGGHTCALSAAGAVRCWGWNGNETENHAALKPEAVGGLESGVTAIAAGGEHTCALAAGDVVRCWGSNYVGQLGSATLPASSVPLQVGGLGSGLLALAAGGSHTCVLSGSAGVECWGQNVQGELGTANPLYSATPVRVSGLKAATYAVALATPAPTPTSPPPTLAAWPVPPTLAALQPGQPVSLVSLHMLDAATGWGIDAGGHILRTTDGGSTWRCVTPPSGTYDERSFFPVDANHAWAAALPVLSGSEGCTRASNCHLTVTVWHTADAGASWQSNDTWQAAAALPRPGAGTGPNAPSSAAAQGLFLLDPATGWFLLEDWGVDTDILTVLARTSDGGKSLREVWRDEGIGRYSGVAFVNKLVGYLGLDQTTFFGRLTGVPTVKAYLAGVETPSLLKTVDGGRTWQTMGLPRLDPLPAGLLAPASADETMLCGVTGLRLIPPAGLTAEVTCRVGDGSGPYTFDYLSPDGGVTWHSWVATGGESFLDPVMGWRLVSAGAGQPGQFQETANAGLDWVTLKMVPWQAARFDFISEQSGWAIIQQGGVASLQRTADGGHHWTELWPVVVDR